MSEHFKNLRGDTPFGAASPEGKRELAVAAALTLIQAKVLNSASSGQLQTEMNNLNKYADQIQAALEVVWGKQIYRRQKKSPPGGEPCCNT